MDELTPPSSPSLKEVRVFVADSTLMSSQLIAGALKRCRNKFDVCALTSNSTEAFRELEMYRPDVAVISAELQDGCFSGFKVLHQLRTLKSKIPAVMLLDSEKRDLVIDSFRFGARGIFCRGYSFNDLPRCIRQVYDGQIWVSNTDLEFLLEFVSTLRPMKIHNTGGMALLTRRERDVVRLVADGMRNEEISQKLNLCEHTVRNYVFRVFNKLGLSSRVELVLYALSGAERDQAP